MPDLPEYVGGDSFPADLWGRAPLRGRAVELVEKTVEGWSETGYKWTAGDLVDVLILHGVLPDETGAFQ